MFRDSPPAMRNIKTRASGFNFASFSHLLFAGAFVRQRVNAETLLAWW
jgi:hypothetical protein